MKRALGRFCHPRLPRLAGGPFTVAPARSSIFAFATPAPKKTYPNNGPDIIA
jgi:hypothetical protein